MGKRRKGKLHTMRKSKKWPKYKDVALKIKVRNDFYRHMHAKDPDTEQEPCAYMPASFSTLLVVGWFSTDSPSVVEWANKTQLCVLIYQWGKTATLATTHTHTHMHTFSHTHIHKVLRNVELINTPTHKDLLFVLFIVPRRTKTPSQRLTFKTQTHTWTHTLTIKRMAPLKAILASNK